MSFNYKVEDFIDLSRYHLYNARFLYRYPLGLFSGGYLLHLSLELFLKSLHISYTKNYPKIHCLRELAEKLKRCLPVP